MTIDEIAEQTETVMLRADGFDNCCVGVVDGCDQNPVLCYSVDMILSQLEQDGMTREEAQEFFDFNIIGAYMGEGTPLFIRTLEEYD